MKSIMGVVSIAMGLLVTSAGAADKQAELDAVQAELKPLRVKAYKEADVKKARAALDAAYKTYWDTVRDAMIRLDPSKKALVEKDVALRKELPAIASEQKTAEKKTAAKK